MTQQDRLELQKKLALLDRNERQRLAKRAADIRRAQTHKIPRRSDPEEDFAGPVRLKPKFAASVDAIMLKLLREEHSEQSRVYEGPRGVVLGLGPGTCAVLHEGQTQTCRLSPDIRQRQQNEIAVGDEAVVEDGEVVAILPRRTWLSRPGVGGRERVIVANVDTVVVVVSVVAPPLHPRLIDRYLVAIRKGGAQPLVCVNKLDLLEDPTELQKLAPYEAAGIPVVRASAQQGQISALRAALQGRLAAFVGHSGVGKSSLLNALSPGLGLDTGAVWAGYGRGTHTTTGSTLHDLGDGMRIIDTPGIREFGLFQVNAQELEEAYPEFEALECRFRDCSHTHEPGCGVREAVESGAVSAERFETYRRLRGSLESG